MNNTYLKLAIQKNGRLTEKTLELLRTSGLEFDTCTQKLYSKCRNFPLEIYYMRDNDIPDYVARGIVDLGIVGQNLIYETNVTITKILNLQYGSCSLMLAVPKESKIQKLSDLRDKKVATTYPKSTLSFFEKNNVPIQIIQMSGSVEIAPTLGIAEAIVDLVSTGATLFLNDLRPLEKIFDSQAVVIANEKTTVVANKKNLLDQLMNIFNTSL